MTDRPTEVAFWIQAGSTTPTSSWPASTTPTTPMRPAVERLGADSSDLLALIDNNEAVIKATGVVLHSYTAPGEEHGIFDFERFYEIEVIGVSRRVRRRFSLVSLSATFIKRCETA